MIAATAAGAPAGAIARPLPPTWPGRGRRRGGLAGRLVRGRCRRRRRRGGRHLGRRAQRHGTGGRALASDALERAHLALREDAVDAEAGRALEHAHARARRRAECAVGRRGVAELRERVLQGAHVLALGPDAQAADAEPAAVARAAALGALEDVQEALRDAGRAIEAGIGAQRAHHRRGVRAELTVRLHRIAEAGQHPLQLLDRRALHAGVQREQRRRARDASGLRRRSHGRRGEYRQEKEQQGLRRTMCEVDGSRHGFRRGQGVSWTPEQGRARWRRMRAAACRCRLTLQDEFAPVVGGLETRRADPNWNRPEPPSGCPAA